MNNWIDLSHFINNQTPVYPGTETPTIKVANTISKDGFKEHSLRIYNHVGTHVDTPAHIFEKGKTLNDFSIDSFQGKALCITLNDETNEKELSNAITKYTPEIVVFNTGWEKKWGDTSYFSQFPVLSKNSIDVLLQHPLKAIGIDAISFDAVDNELLPNHHLLLQNNILLIENLCNLALLPKECFQLFFFPLKLDNLDASPVRVVANL